MTSRPRSSTILIGVGVIVASILIVAGAYIAYLTFSPVIHLATIDETDNSTTQVLAKSQPKTATLFIPKIDVTVPYDQEEDALLKGAWWRQPSNGNPKDGGNFVLSAHRFIMSYTPSEVQKKSPFYNIDKLKIGDEIYVDYQNKRYTYTISELKSVTPDAVSIENRTENPQLTLYSCTFGGSLDGRDVIIAKPTDE